MVVNLEQIQCVISTSDILILNYGEAALPFVEELAGRLRGWYVEEERQLRGESEYPVDDRVRIPPFELRCLEVSEGRTEGCGCGCGLGRRGWIG